LLDVLLQVIEQVPFERALAIFFLVLARLGPLVFIAPFFGGKRLTGTARLVVVLALTLVLWPSAWAASESAPTEVHLVALLAVKEGLVGTALGLLVSIVFVAIEAAGRIIDISRGAQMSQVLTGQGADPSSPFGALLLLFAVVVFLALGGHHMVLSALSRSYQVVPLFRWPRTGAWGGVARLAVVMGGEFFLIALGLSAPVLAANFLVELSLGLAGRMAPQMPAYFVGLPLKAWGGVFIVFLGLPWAVAWFNKLFRTGLRALHHAVSALGG
jgi:flagellar biosynthetic protein FliR